MKTPEEFKSLKLLKGRQYSICSCGISMRLPFCDGGHKILNAKTGSNYKSIKIIASQDTDLNLCSQNWIKNTQST